MPPLALKSSLPGRQKAAVLMLALSPQHSAKLLGMLHEDEIRDISGAMALLGTVRAEIVEQLCNEFVDGIGSQGNVLGSFEATELLLQQALPKDRAHQIMEEIRGPAGRTMWDKLGNVNEAVLANYLKNEYPQTVAVVLSKLKADHAGRVLNLLPEGFSIEVVMRMLRMESVQRDILDGVEQTLRTEFMTNLARTSRRDSHEMMAEIFNSLDRQSEARFLSALEERNKEAAERIKSLMFNFRRSAPPIAGTHAGALARRRERQAAACAQGRVRAAAAAVLRQFVGAGRPHAARRHRVARSGQTARCRRGAKHHREHGERSVRPGAHRRQ